MWELLEPDIAAYERAKNIMHISHGDCTLPPLPSYARTDEVESLTAGKRTHVKSSSAQLRFIDLAANGDTSRTKYVGLFPGSILPGLKGGEDYVGPLAYERWIHAIAMKGRGFSLDDIADDFTFKGEPPSLILHDADSPSYWIEGIEVPLVELISLKGLENIHPMGSIDDCIEKSNNLLITSLRSNHIGSALTLLNTLQNPYVPSHPLVGMYEVFAEFLFDNYKVHERESPLPVAMQIQQAAQYLSTLDNIQRVCSFDYGGVYLEVHAFPFENLQSAELFDHSRIAKELRTFVNTGAFAPIIIEEHGVVTDGTHRHLSFSVYNLLHELQDQSLDASSLNDMRGKLPFLKSNLHYRNTIEALAYLQDQHPNLLRKLRTFATKNKTVEYVPVILGMEPQACVVVKEPFDRGEDTIGIPSPFFYQEIRNSKGSIAISARGPYHRTDRSIIPWYRIIQK